MSDLITAASEDVEVDEITLLTDQEIFEIEKGNYRTTITVRFDDKGIPVSSSYEYKLLETK